MGGTVTALHLYPVKGLRGVAREAARVEPIGLDGDRRWMVVTPEGEFVTQRQVATMATLDAVPDVDGIVLGSDGAELAVARPAAGGEALAVRVWGTEVPAAVVDAAADRWLSDRLGMACRLVFLLDPRGRRLSAGHNAGDDHVSFADEFPLLLTSTGSLAALNAVLEEAGGMAVPMDRFRANVVVEGVPAWEEQRWRRVRIGAATFRVPKPCARCVVITRDQRTGETPAPGEPLKTLGRVNRSGDGILFGLNLVPEGEAEIRVGDAVVGEE